MFSRGWGEADFQRRIQTGALYVQNTHIYMEQLHRDGTGRQQEEHIEQHDLQSSHDMMNIF